MGRGIRAATPRDALLAGPPPLLLVLPLLLLPATRALSARISLPLGECRGPAGGVVRRRP